MDISKYMRERLESKRILLMCHAIVGFPSLEDNWSMLNIMAEAGVDIVELQMPFSEPIADGPDFVRANHGAIKGGIQVKEYFEFVERVTSTLGIPTLVMGYYNLAFRMGHGNFARSLQESGACGYILPDLPPEEDDDLRGLCEQADISPILMMTPTNTKERLAKIAAKGEGFMYCAARKGTTGPETDFDDKLLDEFIERCRDVTSLPLGLGFGIRSAEDVRGLSGRVDMAIVGTQLLRTWERSGTNGYSTLLKEMASACNS